MKQQRQQTRKEKAKKHLDKITFKMYESYKKTYIDDTHNELKMLTIIEQRKFDDKKELN